MFWPELADRLKDWEYPGAQDRGGSERDGENYTALLKELREAIDATGRDYIVTFTAPSSYWYLRHFDLKAMEAHVDWINLMSYDLHGIWDSNNPIGNRVLSHTNLTEIDLALNLVSPPGLFNTGCIKLTKRQFWRVGVEPSNVVLGLGFYGRSFELESPSCWKPGCAFQGPGSPGPCSKSAGILAYHGEHNRKVPMSRQVNLMLTSLLQTEIMDILDKTGGTPYLDESAAARYMVYDGHSWIS